MWNHFLLPFCCLVLFSLHIFFFNYWQNKTFLLTYLNFPFRCKMFQNLAKKNKNRNDKMESGINLDKMESASFGLHLEDLPDEYFMSISFKFNPDIFSKLQFSLFIDI